MTAEVITQVPVQEVQYVERRIPKVRTEGVEKIIEVPHTLIEEQLIEVPQVQIAEAVRQVPKEMVQRSQKAIPKFTTQVVEKVQQVGVPLINEVGLEVPQVQTVEVVKQTANVTTQRIVQQESRQYELGTQAYRTMPEERVAGVYQAPVVGVRENAMVQPTVVERVSPVMTGVTETQRVGSMTVAPTYVETMAAPQEMMVAPTTLMAPGTLQGTVEVVEGEVVRGYL
jgi:hypothetical protein